VFERLARGAVTVRLDGVPGDVTMTRDNVAEAVRYMTYSSRESSRVPLLLHRAHGGDFSGLAAFLRRYRTPGTFEALYLSITCAEDVPFLPADAATRDKDTYLGDYRVRQQQAACRDWPRGAAAPTHGTPVRSRVPVLITSGMLDPVTPPAFGDEVAQTLTDVLHLKVPSGAHGLRGLTGLDCLERIDRDFVDRGTTASLDVACVTKIRRAGFDR
jgi:pimeloyl-ACP methyl ester carboxylesterase